MVYPGRGEPWNWLIFSKFIVNKTEHQLLFTFLDDPTATKLVKLTDDLLRLAEGPTSITVNMLPNPNLALLPGLKQLTGLHYVEACFGNVAEFLKKYIEGNH